MTKHNGRMILERPTVVGIEVRWAAEDERRLNAAVDRWHVKAGQPKPGAGSPDNYHLRRLARNFVATKRSEGMQLEEALCAGL